MENILENYERLAKVLVEHSCRVQKGEKVLIEFFATDSLFIEVLSKMIIDKGAYPIFWHHDNSYKKIQLKYGNEELFSLLAKYDSYVMQDVDAVMLIKGAKNTFEMSDIDISQMASFDRCYNEVVHTKHRLSKKWVLLRFPCYALAQASQMSVDAFSKFFFDVCTLDYDKMHSDMLPLKSLMEKTDKVRIVGDETDLTFSIKGMNAVICSGECNIPDGEIYTAPIRESINGQIKFNVNMNIDGLFYPYILLKFKDGKVVECSDARFDKVLDTDAGARYVGEFAFGVNKMVTRPYLDILFDEKMQGSIHMALGSAYDDAFNGNTSAIHIDLIHCQKDQYGGGEIYFDDVLIRKNGEFVLEELKNLN